MSGFRFDFQQQKCRFFTGTYRAGNKRLAEILLACLCLLLWLEIPRSCLVWYSTWYKIYAEFGSNLTYSFPPFSSGFTVANVQDVMCSFHRTNWWWKLCRTFTMWIVSNVRNVVTNWRKEMNSYWKIANCFVVLISMWLTPNLTVSPIVFSFYYHI